MAEEPKVSVTVKSPEWEVGGMIPARNVGFAQRDEGLCFLLAVATSVEPDELSNKMKTLDVGNTLEISIDRQSGTFHLHFATALLVSKAVIIPKMEPFQLYKAAIDGKPYAGAIQFEFYVWPSM